MPQRNNRLRLAKPKLDKLKVMPWTKDKKASILKRGLYPAMLMVVSFMTRGRFLLGMYAPSPTVWFGRGSSICPITSPLSSPVRFCTSLISGLRNVVSSPFFGPAACNCRNGGGLESGSYKTSNETYLGSNYSFDVSSAQTGMDSPPRL